MGFWIIAGALTVAVAAVFAMAMLRGRTASRPVAGAASDVQVYRDQLDEVERDLARGVLSPDEADAVRVEISRRLLEADRAAQSADAPVDGSTGGAPRVMIAALAVVVIGGALGLYASLGAPGYPDMPLQVRIANAEDARENRPTQAEAEAELVGAPQAPRRIDPSHLELIDQLRAALADRPDDLQGFTLLTRNEAALGNFGAAHIAQERVIELKGAAATAQDYADLADLKILAAGGYVSPEAEEALLQALRRDPSNGPALYYTGLLYAQNGRPDRAFAVWRPLLESSDPRAPWYLPIRAQIEELAQLAGVRYVPPLPPAPAELGAETDLRGPTQEQMEAAQDMDMADRAAMIEGMVANLSDRLANSGGTAQEWAQLIQALVVLGRVEQARAIADEALGAFADEPQLLPIIQQAMARSGLSQ